MQIIPLQPLPSQEFSVPLDNNQWDFTIKYVNGSIAVTLLLNGNIVIEGMHIVGGMRIIPSVYEESGNFVLVTGNYQIPDYTQFGASQQLIYISAAELTAVRVPPPPIVTAAYFDPNAALPLRLFPQGYSIAVNFYETEGPDSYITESGDTYITEMGSDIYVTETDPLYVTEDGLSFYTTEST